MARITIRNADMVSAAQHYGLTIATCVVTDPESKGGSEATVRVAKADLVPCEANLLPAYPNFAALEAACDALCEEVKNQAHWVTRRAPVEMPAEDVGACTDSPPPPTPPPWAYPGRGDQHPGDRPRGL